MSAFKDHFSERSAEYAAYRPTYPVALVEALAGLCAGTEAALDVGCGTGQLSVLLARRFRRVIATDASPQQIAAAEPAERVEYRVAPAEASGLPESSVDLVTAAQAAHWFDLPGFHREARRVARPGGLLALISYGVLEAEGPLDAVLKHFYREVVGPYWPPERRHVEEGYRSLAFPFPELGAPSLAIEVSWTRPDLLGYVGTWSAVRAAERALGRAPLEAFVTDLAAAWPDPQERRALRFPLSARLGRLNGGGRE